jgi:hypothetical protein
MGEQNHRQRVIFSLKYWFYLECYIRLKSALFGLNRHENSMSQDLYILLLKWLILACRVPKSRLYMTVFKS